MTYGYTNNDQLTCVTSHQRLVRQRELRLRRQRQPEPTGYRPATGNQLSTDGTYNYTYDADGNLMTRTQISTGNKTVYTYDYHNRLTGGGQRRVRGDDRAGDVHLRRAGPADRHGGGSTTTWTLYDGKGDDPLMDFVTGRLCPRPATSTGRRVL